jgi:hypothetical protein
MTRKQILTGALMGILIIYSVSTYVVEKRLSGLKNYLDISIESKYSDLRALAPMVASGAVSGQVSSFVKDCPAVDNQEYETLLSSLDKGLSKGELLKLQSLFNECGRIPASKRAATVMQLNYEVENLNTLISQRLTLGGLKLDETKLYDWQTLVSKEEETSLVFLSLVESQGEIINVLIKGASTSEVEEVSSRARKMRDDLNNLAAESTKLRTPLI